MLRTTLASSRNLRVCVLGLVTFTTAIITTSDSAEARRYRHRHYARHHVVHHVARESYSPQFASIIIDGSFCRGTDVVKAIALGADAVAMGRLYCYALAAEGDVGVHRLLEILEQEVMVAMALAGARSLAELNRSFLHFGAPPVTTPHVHSAFPLLFRTPEAPG